MGDSAAEQPVSVSRPRLHRKGLLREGVQTLLFLVGVYILLEMAIPRSVVLSISMEPNLVAEQRLLISRISYLFGNPARGDIVVFTPPNVPASDPPLIKRLIGLPGETIEFRDTYVYINGVKLDEPYINEPCVVSSCPNETIQLGADDYFSWATTAITATTRVHSARSNAAQSWGGRFYDGGRPPNGVFWLIIMVILNIEIT